MHINKLGGLMCVIIKIYYTGAMAVPATTISRRLCYTVNGRRRVVLTRHEYKTKYDTRTPSMLYSYIIENIIKNVSPHRSNVI